MPFTVVGPETFRTMPWKDGGGVTTELAIDPPGASVAGPFRWRLSMARVERSGPFSRFPGMDRSLAVLAGAMEVEVGGARHCLVPGGEVLRFSGDAASSGTQLEGPVLDFNLISDRARIRHRLERLAVGPEPSQIDAAPLRLLFAPATAVDLESWGRLEPGFLLRVDGEGALGVSAHQAGDLFIAWLDSADQRSGQSNSQMA